MLHHDRTAKPKQNHELRQEGNRGRIDKDTCDNNVHSSTIILSSILIFTGIVIVALDYHCCSCYFYLRLLLRLFLNMTSPLALP